MFEIDLGDWVSAFDETLGKVLGFLDLPVDPACALFYKSGRLVRSASSQQVRRPINASGIGRWKAYADQLKPLLDGLAEVAPA